MPDPAPTTDAHAPQTPATVTATVENRDASGTLLGRQRLKMESEFGNTPQGMMANIWSKLGMLAAVVIAFFGMMAWFAYTVNAQVDAAREEAREVRQAAEKERKDAVDRYIASRVANDARHQEVLAKLDKVMIFTERLMDWYFKEGGNPKKSASNGKGNEVVCKVDHERLVVAMAES